MELMTPQQAKAAMDAGTAVIIDVREDDELAQAAIPGAVHIPMGDSGGRSENVCRYLEENEGFSGLVNLEGGIVAWSQAGLPISQ
jgi:queuine tRNA-ribosyltransferase